MIHRWNKVVTDNLDPSDEIQSTQFAEKRDISIIFFTLQKIALNRFLFCYSPIDLRNQSFFTIEVLALKSWSALDLFVDENNNFDVIYNTKTTLLAVLLLLLLLRPHAELSCE